MFNWSSEYWSRQHVGLQWTSPFINTTRPPQHLSVLGRVQRIIFRRKSNSFGRHRAGGTLFAVNDWNSQQPCWCSHFSPLASAPVSSLTQQNIFCKHISSSLRSPSHLANLWSVALQMAGWLMCKLLRGKTTNSSKCSLILCSPQWGNTCEPGTEQGVALAVTWVVNLFGSSYYPAQRWTVSHWTVPTFPVTVRVQSSMTILICGRVTGLEPQLYWPLIYKECRCYFSPATSFWH